jgi:CRISPR-associated protein Cas1
LDVLTHRPPRTIDALLGIEGRAAFSYFSAWQSLPLQWKGIGRRPVPDDWHQIGPRTSGKNRVGTNRNATHPVNAILNYAYAVLESQVRMQIAADGYDPTIGFLHTYNMERPALAFDLMEPLRPVVDARFWTSCSRTRFSRRISRSDPMGYAGSIRRWRGMLLG